MLSDLLHTCEVDCTFCSTGDRFRVVEPNRILHSRLYSENDDGSYRIEIPISLYICRIYVSYRAGKRKTFFKL